MAANTLRLIRRNHGEEKKEEEIAVRGVRRWDTGTSGRQRYEDEEVDNSIRNERFHRSFISISSLYALLGKLSQTSLLIISPSL